MLYPSELSSDFILTMPASTFASKSSTDNAAAARLSKSYKPGIPRPASIRHSLAVGKTGVSKALADVINHKQGHDSPPKDASKEPRRQSGVPFGSKHASVPSKPRERDSSADADREGRTAPKFTASTMRANGMNSANANIAGKGSANSPPKSVAHPPSATSSPSSRRNTLARPPSAPTPTLRSRPSNQSNSSGASQPKPKTRSALPVPKSEKTDPHVTRRKRRGSEDDGMPDHLDTLEEIASRPISPLPKRTRVVIKRPTPSGPSGPSGPDAKDAPRASLSKNSTPTPTKATTGSTSLPRPRTISTATSSANTRVSQSSSAPAPVKRVEKRPRLSSDAAAKAGRPQPSVTVSPPIRRVASGSVAILSEDMSSDSISVADVSALLDVTPLRATPAASRKASLNRLVPGRGAAGNLNPSKRHASHGLPTRQNMTYLSPMSASLGNGRGANSKNRTSILSWAEVSKDMEEDQLLAEVQAPFTRVVSRDSSIFNFPHDGSFSFDTTPKRERVDSGWGPESPTGLVLNLSTIDRCGRKKKPSLVPDGRLSIGQVLFPSVDEQEENDYPDPTSPESPVESTAVKLLQLQVHSQEERAQHYLTKIAMLEEKLQMSQVNGALGESQNAMLEQRISALEEDLVKSQKSLMEKENSFGALTRRVRELETLRATDEGEFQRQLEDAREEMEVVQENVEQRVQEEIEDAVDKALAAERRRSQFETARRERRSETRLAWGRVHRTAKDELDAVRAARESLAVLLSGLTVHMHK